MMRWYASLLFIIFSLVSKGQVTNPYTGEILPFEKIGDFSLSEGNFNSYPVQYGLINHIGRLNALPFIVIEQDTLKPWMVILNGGPGRSNLRLSFELDSILRYYNVLIPGYRGIDDKIFDGFKKVSKDSLELFIANHKNLFGSENISSDIKQIAGHLNIKSLTLLGHSFGTLVSAEFATLYPSLVDTIFAFSPVSFTKPYPSAQKLRNIVDSLSIELGYSPDLIVSKLSKLNEHCQSANFYMGVISSFYTHSDIINFLHELEADQLSSKIIEQKGERFVQQEWLFDFGLKFCKIDSLANPVEDVYDEIAKGFITIISRYVTDDGCVEIDVDYDSLPVQVYLPKYDFFYYSADNTVYDTCNCAHADLWRKAPEIIFKNKRLSE